MIAKDFIVAIERGETYSVELVPFYGDATEHARRTGKSLAELIDRAFPGEAADDVIAGIVAARLAEHIDAGEVEDPDFDCTAGVQAEGAPLCRALIVALDPLDVTVRFDDV